MVSPLILNTREHVQSIAAKLHRYKSSAIFTKEDRQCTQKNYRLSFVIELQLDSQQQQAVRADPPMVKHLLAGLQLYALQGSQTGTYPNR